MRIAIKRCVVIGVAVATIGLGGCGSDRPSVEEWQPNWDQITAAIPEQGTGQPGLTADICSETLAFLRSNRASLNPTPDFAIDGVVTSWIEIAENAFFECPPDNEQIHDFAAAYAEMLRLEAEVDLVLEMDR